MGSTAVKLDESSDKKATPAELMVGGSPHKRLNQWLATGICGNDITSSCLYVSAIAAVFAGVMAPVVLLMVIGVLYLYKKVYIEVVEALPLNGGTYNCLLNSTSKFTAAMSACMTILSYVATAVISAKTGIDYLHSLYPQFNVITATIIVLAVFAILAIIGITESAVVALSIFIFHMATMALFCAIGFFNIPSDFHVFKANLMTLPSGEGLLIALALGFSAALLGISGFESSANFVEEQQAGVFRKTLRNMLIAVAIINPLTSILSLNLIHIDKIIIYKEHLLSHMAFLMGGQSFRVVLVVDAALVLAGAVLTSFVGVTGLVQRMALDQCLPQFLLKKNRRGTSHRIIFTFFLLCSSILIVTEGNLLSLAGVYTISFLGVMTLFGLGNILLKIRRKELKRTYRAGWFTILVAITATSLGIVGNVIIDYKNLIFFLQYFMPAILLVVMMYLRIPLLKAILQVLNNVMTRLLVWRSIVVDRINVITNQKVVVFTRGGNMSRLHDALTYIRHNESSRSIVVFHLFNEPDDDESDAIEKCLETLGQIFTNLKIEFYSRRGRFGPEIIETVSRDYDVAVNNIFIGAPEEKHNFSIQELGGVRVIF